MADGDFTPCALNLNFHSLSRRAINIR